MKKKQPTMKDVARLAGVSQPTVSYVINGTATISDDVKERVYKAIKELDYKPNYNAIALKTKRSHVIGIMVPDITNAYYSGMASLLEKRLTKEGYSVLINSTGYKETVEKLLLQKLLAQNVEAFIITYQFSCKECWDILKESGKEVIAIEAGVEESNFAQIETDNYFGAYIATKHLIETGKTRIAYIGQNSQIEALKNREKGYIEALKEEGYNELIIRTDVSEAKWKEGIRVGEEIADLDIDGLVISSDEIAVGVLKSLISNKKKRIPEDIAIIGYDDIPIAKLFIPELSTIKQPIEEMCSDAVGMLLDMVAGNTVKSLILKPELIIRNTSI